MSTTRKKAESKPPKILKDPGEPLTCVLGVDPSSDSTGWAIIRLDAESQVKKVTRHALIKVPPKWKLMRRLYVMATELARVLKDFPEIQAVGIELPMGVKNTRTTLTLGKVSGAISFALKQVRPFVPIRTYMPGAWRKFFLGFEPKSDKFDLKETVWGIAHETYPEISIPLSENDVTDAIGIGTALLNEHGLKGLNYILDTKDDNIE